MLKIVNVQKRKARQARWRDKNRSSYYKQWYQKRIQQGLCTVCNNPAVVTLRTREDKPPVYCELHKERHRLRAYKKRGIFGTTDKQAKVITKNNVLSRMKTELGSKFDEVKDFIESNLDIFKEEFDRPIALSVPLQENYEES